MMKLYWSGVGPKSKDYYSYKETQTHTHMHEDRGRNQRDEAGSQGAPRIAGHWQRWGQGEKGILSRAFRERMVLPIPAFRLIGSRTVRE